MQPNDIIGKTLKQLNDLKKILPIDSSGKTLKQTPYKKHFTMFMKML